MPPCSSIPTSATGPFAPTTRASTGASSWAWARRASTAGPCARRRRRLRATARSSRARRPPRRAGFRPCLRCRPELAPGYATVDANRRLAQAAAGLIEDGRLEDASLAELAAHAGRHRPAPAPRLPAGVRRLARGVRADAAPAAGQAAPHRHGDAGPRGGDGERLREPAPLQRPLPHALPHVARTASQGGAREPAPGPAFLRPRLPPALRLAGDARLPRPPRRSPVSRPSTAAATGAACASSARDKGALGLDRDRALDAQVRPARRRRAPRSPAPCRCCSRA